MAFRKAKVGGNVLAFVISLAVVPFFALRQGKVVIILDSWKLAVMGRLGRFMGKFVVDKLWICGLTEL